MKSTQDYISPLLVVFHGEWLFHIVLSSRNQLLFIFTLITTDNVEKVYEEPGMNKAVVAFLDDCKEQISISQISTTNLLVCTPSVMDHFHFNHQTNKGVVYFIVSINHSQGISFTDVEGQLPSAMSF